MELVVRCDGREERVEVQRDGETYRVKVGDRLYEVESASAGPLVRSLLIGRDQFEVAVRRNHGGHYVVTSGGATSVVEVVDPLTHLARASVAARRADALQRVTAYMPGKVVSVLVEEGQTVEAGQGVVVLEAMKMENEIQAERAGIVRRIMVRSGEAVEGGDPLFELAPAVSCT